jgi:hypothetical protein
LVFTENNGTATMNETASFNVVYRSATTDKVTTTFNTGTENASETAWILKNGTTIAVYISAGAQGFNETGSEANTMIVGVFAGFYEEIEIGGNQGLYAAESQYFHSTGTSVVTIGGSQVTVKNYVANSANEVVNVCGSSSTYTNFALAIGTPSGTNFPIVTSLAIAGSTTENGSPTNFNYSLHLTAFQVA